MEAVYIFVGALLGAASVWLGLRSTSKKLEEANTLGKTLAVEKEELLKQNQNALLQQKEAETRLTQVNEIYTELKNQYEGLNAQYRELLSENAALGSRNESLLEKIQTLDQEMEKTRLRMENEFRLMANEILEEKTRRFTEVNQQELSRILAPLRENIVDFRSKVEETYDKESKQRFSLEEKIKELVTLNNQISEDAKSLTKALKGDSKVQGDWGEMILETILEKSGLQKGREYSVQETLSDEHGKTIITEGGRKMRPDVIIYYPDDRKIIVDSKVSLTAYIRYTEAETKEQMNRALNEHIRSVKAHIDELSQKAYQDFAKSLDFVMMFIPNEPAYMLALQSDNDLWQYAYDRRVVLISPTNLITALKLVADMWKRDNQSKNALEIAERGGRLYDKFVILAKTLDEVGNNLRRTTKSYEDALGQLRDGSGNLMGQVHKLHELGVKAKKQLIITEKRPEDETIL